MDKEKEMTTLNASVGADAGQSLICTDTTITDPDADFNNYFLEQQRLLQRMMDPSYLKTVTMTELYEKVELTPPSIIEGLLMRGTYLLAGSPKVGKSFLVAQLAYHVSTGTPLWGYSVRKGTVLYLALEDSFQRLQERSYRMFDTAENENLHFAIYAGQIGNGLDAQLKNFMREHPDTCLIIIDTLQKVREAGGETYSYASDYQIVGSLKQFADSYGICMILVHHTRKQQADDRFDMISGTNGLMGAADGAFVLYKKNRTDNKAILDVAGRDQPEQRFNLIRNEETLVWDLESVEKELWKMPPEPILDEVAKHITEESPDWQGTPTELVALLGVDMKPNVLSQKLNVNASRLLNEYNIRYSSSRSHDGRRITFHLELPPA